MTCSTLILLVGGVLVGAPVNLSDTTPLPAGRSWAPEKAPVASYPTETSWKVPALHAAGTLMAMRISAEVLWPRAYDPTQLGSQVDGLRRAYTSLPEFRRDRPLLESDGDPWSINVFAHGAFGSEIYARTRECGHGIVASFAATAAASTVWEYALEAPYKRPSAVDLVWTPVVGGLVFGEGRFQLHRWLKGLAPSAARSVMLVVTDPFGEFERAALRAGC